MLAREERKATRAIVTSPEEAPVLQKEDMQKTRGSRVTRRMRSLAGHLFWLGLWRFLDAGCVVRAPPHMARGRFSGNHVGHGELFRAI